MINTIDNAIYETIIKIMNSNITAIMIFISFLGSAITLITLALASIFLVNSKLKMLNLALSFILNRILKLIIARPRPPRLRLVIENGYSFPSGHSMVSFAFYGFLIYLINKNLKNKKIKYPLIILLSLLILLIGISRIYLGVHYVTDVLGGYIIGLIYLIVFIKILKKKKIKL